MLTEHATAYPMVLTQGHLLKLLTLGSLNHAIRAEEILSAAGLVFDRPRTTYSCRFASGETRLALLVAAGAADEGIAGSAAMARRLREALDAAGLTDGPCILSIIPVDYGTMRRFELLRDEVHRYIANALGDEVIGGDSMPNSRPP